MKKTIKQFENYSKIYESVIELDRNDEDSDNIYTKVYNIIKSATFTICQDDEKFLFHENDKINSTNLEKLIHLKNRIHIKNEKEEKNENLKDEEDNEVETKKSGDDKLKYKRKILIFYKKIISNLEIIMEYMTVLRNKGSSLPIKINMEIKIDNNNNPSIAYYLGDNDKEEQFEKIRDFLFDAKTSYIAQLESMYKQKLNLRFLYGKQFRSIMKHLEISNNLEPFFKIHTK